MTVWGPGRILTSQVSLIRKELFLNRICLEMALVDLSCLNICVLFTRYGNVLKGKKRGGLMSVSVSSFRRVRLHFGRMKAKRGCH